MSDLSVKDLKEVIMRVYSENREDGDFHDRFRSALLSIRRSDKACTDVISLYNKHRATKIEDFTNRSENDYHLDIYEFVYEITNSLQIPFQQFQTQGITRGEFNREKIAQYKRVERLIDITKTEGFDFKFLAIEKSRYGTIGEKYPKSGATFTDFLNEYLFCLAQSEYQLGQYHDPYISFEAQFIRYITGVFYEFTGSGRPAIAIRFLKLIHGVNKPPQFGKDNQYKP